MKFKGFFKENNCFYISKWELSSYFCFSNTSHYKQFHTQHPFGPPSPYITIHGRNWFTFIITAKLMFSHKYCTTISKSRQTTRFASLKALLRVRSNRMICKRKASACCSDCVLYNAKTRTIKLNKDTGHFAFHLLEAGRVVVHLE